MSTRLDPWGSSGSWYVASGAPQNAHEDDATDCIAAKGILRLGDNSYTTFRSGESLLVGEVVIRYYVTNVAQGSSRRTAVRVSSEIV